MKAAASALLRALRRAIDAVAALLLVAVLCVAAAQVTARYVLSVSMPWGEELTRLLFVWLVLIAAARTPHMQIDLLPQALGSTGRTALAWFGGLLAILLLGLLAWYGLALVELTAEDRYTALGVSVQYLYWSLVVGSALWIVTTIAGLVAGPAADEKELPPA